MLLDKLIIGICSYRNSQPRTFTYSHIFFRCFHHASLTAFGSWRRQAVSADQPISRRIDEGSRGASACPRRCCHGVPIVFRTWTVPNPGTWSPSSGGCRRFLSLALLCLPYLLAAA
jgi:hypothetical protein